MSTSAAGHLPPAFPERAPWGTAAKLRAWQEEALDGLPARGQQRDFLAVATPGAGKTTYALRIATELLDRGVIRAVTVVAPTEHLKHQWSDAAARVGIHLNPAFSNSTGLQSHEYDGVALTYAQVASKPQLHRRRTQETPTLVILDEIHHGGDARSWGDGIREAFEPAARRLSLTGTPFRSDTNPIPFVRYEMGEDGILRSASDYSYGYAAALRDGVVRPVLFLAYGGAMRWRTKAGDEVAARLGEPLTKDLTAQAWRTALDPKGEWVPSVLAAADTRLSEVRRHVPDAGGHGHRHRPDLGARVRPPPARHHRRGPHGGAVRRRRGERRHRARSPPAPARWMVAVRMVSEGVDVPRLCVGVYATSTSTPLFFAQAVGRFVRARRRGETASVFLPSVPIMLTHAATMEEERDHALNRPSSDEAEASLWAEEEGLLAAANRTEQAVGPEDAAFEALESDAHFDHVLFDAQQFGLHAAVGLGGGAGLPRAARAARARAGGHPAERAAGEADQGGGRSRWRGDGIRARTGVGPPGAGRTAQGAQQAGRGLLVEDRQPARQHPPRAAARVRRARAGGGYERAGARAGGADPALVRRPSLTLAHASPDVHRPVCHSTRGTPDAGLGSPIVTHTDTHPSSAATRRQLLTMAAVGGAGLFAATDAQAASAHDRPHGPTDQPGHFRLTVLGTTDLHGNVYNWNYFSNAAYERQPRATRSASPRPRRSSRPCAPSAAPTTASPSTRATPSRAPRWPTTSPRSTRSPRARSTRWPPR